VVIFYIAPYQFKEKLVLYVISLLLSC